MQTFDFLVNTTNTSARKQKRVDIYRIVAVTYSVVSMSIRLLLSLFGNVVFAAMLLWVIPLFFASSPITFEEWQDVAQSEVLHRTAFLLGAVFTFLNIVGRRGI